MSIDISRYLSSDPASRFVSPVMATMEGSQILQIAAEVRKLREAGRVICDLTIGDFDPNHFPIPESLREGIGRAYAAGNSNYPPADGIGPLKEAISDLYARELGLDYGADSVCVTSGARPPLYTSWRLFTSPGERTVTFLPSWNCGYYAHICQTRQEYVTTTAASNFFPTVNQVREKLPGTRLMLINSPLNPTGTAIDRDVLAGIAQAFVDENQRRSKNEPPAMLIYDQVYWLLTNDGVTHYNPVSLVPECAPYVINVDAISKCFAATGLRVGWAVLPPALQAKMRALVGHIGSWAPRPEQVATAALLSDPDAISAYMAEFKGGIFARLQKLYAGISAMRSRGLPVDAISPQGALYLSFRANLIGEGGFRTNEEIRRYLLQEAGVAVVPFQAFDMREENGWFRMSVGAVGLGELDEALGRLEQAIAQRA